MKFLVIDCGIFVEMANALADKGKNTVYYYTDWEKSMPAWEDYVAGKDFDYLIKVKYFWETLATMDKEKDIIVNYDVNNSDLIEHLRQDGWNCFGAGKGVHLEQERWTMKEVLKKAGLPQNHAVKIKGITKLREYLKDNKDKYIKVDTFRRDIESFYAKDLPTVEPILDDIQAILGAFKDEFEFIVEDSIHTDQEFGIDGFFNGEEYLFPCFLGLELHKECYIAKVIDEFPENMGETLYGLQPTLQECNYRGSFSTEEKFVTEKKHYFLDWCSRLLWPDSVLYVEAIRNWPELIAGIARGEYVEPDIREKYWGAVPINSAYAGKHWVAIDFDPKLRKNVKMISATKVNGKYYGVKGQEIVAVAVAGGETIDEVVEKLKEIVAEVHIHGCGSEVGHLDEMKEIMEKGSEVGVDFS